VIGIVKQNTSRELKQKFPFLKKVYWGTDAVWSEGYFESTVGIDEAVIQAYIENQGKKMPGKRSLNCKVPRACPWISSV